MGQSDEARIIDSWKKNVSPWTSAVRHGRIESRQQATNRAIIEAVLRQEPGAVIDLGCGEGWLVRELAPRVPRLLGVDAVPALIEQARDTGGGDFLVVSYEAVSAGAVKEQFDVAVCNFSLLGKESVNRLFAAVPSILKPDGAFVVQTLHPVMACGDFPYADGWREGSWTGFDPGFVDPAPWYFRTLESWATLFADNGFRLESVREPVHPKTRKPVSIIFTGTMPVAP